MPKKALFADAEEVKPPSPIRNFPSLPAPNFQKQQEEEENMTDSNQSMDMEIDSDEAVQCERNEPQQSKEEMLISFDSPAKNVPKLYPEIADDAEVKRLSFPSIFKNHAETEVPAEEEDQTMDFTEIPKQQGQPATEKHEQPMEFTRIPGNGQPEDEEQTMDFTQVQQHNSGMIDDEEQTMEMTRPIGGLNRQYDENDEEEERTMDFTRTYGGNNWTNEDQEQTMEMTRAVGSIQKPQSMGNGDEDEQTMEMTQALGKINRDVQMLDEDEDDGEQTMEFTKPLQARANEDEADDYGEQTMEFTRPLQYNTNENNADDEGELTMEFTKALPAKVDQQQQEDDSAESLIPQPKTPPKKSPRKSKSPASSKSGNKTGKSPMKATSKPIVTTSPSKNTRKRSSSPRKAATPSPSKKPKLSVSEEPPAAATPVKQVTSSTAATAPGSQRTPSQVLKDQIQSLTPRRSSARRTPSKSASAKKQSIVLPFETEKVSYTPLRSVKKPTNYVNMQSSSLDVAGNSSPTPSKKRDLSTSLPPIQEPEYQNVSLQDFLNMISIDFMDDFLTSTRGHSSFGVTYEPSEEPTFTDYVVSAQKLPLLELYDFSSREMKNNVRDAKELFSQLEAETLEENPLLFREYIEASADTKQVMSSQFKLIKSYARQQAKSVWYDWRTQLTNGVYEAFRKNLTSLQDDQKMIGAKRPAVEKAYNDISSKYMEMKNKLERMRKRSAELANCDRDELLAAQELLSTRKRDLATAQMSLEEQTKQVRDYRELVETQLQEKRKLQDSIQAAEKIRQANKRIDMQDIADLREQFMTIQKCMDFDQCTLSGTVFEGIVQETLRVKIQLETKEITTEPISQPIDDASCLSFLNRQVTNQDDKTKPLVDRLNNIRKLWFQANKMNREINLYRLRHIISFSEETLDNEPALVLSTRLFAEKPAPSKMYVKIRIKGSSITTYPSQIQGNITLSVMYGEEWGKSMGETCGQLEQSLLSNGLPGVFNKCIGILQGN